MRGVPIDAIVPNGVMRIREWPNRLGVNEPSAPDDEVLWRPFLASRPRTGTERAVDLTGRSVDPSPYDDLADRTRWMQGLVRTLSQYRGVMSAAEVIAPCAVVLTPGTAAGRCADAPSFDGGLGPCPRRLGEFPGGIQLAVTDSVWARRDEYAAIVTTIMSEGA